MSRITGARIVLAYKNFGAARHLSHIGLGVSALNTAKVLRRAGIVATVVPILSAADLEATLVKEPAAHVIIAAPWIATRDLNRIANCFPDTQFYVNCHSNVGFLQADRNGVRLIRETIELELATHNVHLAGNSTRFCDWIEAAFARPSTYLPNLYYLDENADRAATHRVTPSGTLRIGIFGATRPLKNLMTAAAAAVQIGRTVRLPLEIWMSAGRNEGGGETVQGSIWEMLSGLPAVTLRLNGWQAWPQFRETVAHMHLLLQPSYTESFNMVSADGVAEGVPSVVSSAIAWAPDHWKADVDDASDIARVGRILLNDQGAAADGLRALKTYVEHGLSVYQELVSTDR